jgi:glycerol-3-phosphate O-acyltransferase
LTYDKVIEEESYKKELSGEKKAKENFSQLLQTWRIFKINYGKAYIKFGDPIFLEEYFDRTKPEWRQSIDEHLTKPVWMTPVVNQLADHCLEGVNNATVVSPVALLASVVPSSAASSYRRRRCHFYTG